MIRIFLSLTELIFRLLGSAAYSGALAFTGLLGSIGLSSKSAPPAVDLVIMQLAAHVLPLFLAWLVLRLVVARRQLSEPVPGRHWLTAGLVCTGAGYLLSFTVAGKSYSPWLAMSLHWSSLAAISFFLVGLTLAARSLKPRTPTSTSSEGATSDPDLATEKPRLTNLSLANLALGVAFALSSLFSIGAKVLGVLGVTSVLRLLEPYQQHILLALAGYWLPAILIYIFFRLTRLDSRLQPTTAVHSTILTANLLLVLYVATRVFASTVPGGGASFAVISMSPLVIFPAWALLAFGFITLANTSLRSGDVQPVSGRPQRFTASDGGLVVFALLLPASFSMTLPIAKMITLSTEFSRLCNSAEIKVLEPVQGAKSVALLPDSFSSMAWKQKAETRPWTAFLLNQSYLEFLERPATRESGIEGKAKYERVSTIGERILRSKPGSTAVTQYVYEPVEELTAEYEVRPARLTLEQGAELGLGGARIEIRRRLDNHLVAYAQYYWNNTESRACPQESHSGMFIYHFVAGALGVKNPEGPK